MFGAIGLLAIILAIVESNPVFWIAFHILPGFKLFRSWGRLFFYTNFSLAILAGLVISNPPSNKKVLWRLLIVQSIILVIIFIATIAAHGR